MKIGFFLSGEEYSPVQLIAQARAAEEAGFQALWISDHFHPWTHEQGNAGFVWAVIGALSQVTSRVPVTTGVTCPIMRIHPVITAQAAATSATLLPGRFGFGVGTGEALNEQVLGEDWPEADVRLEMLEEAVELMRRLWTGEVVSHEGRHFRSRHAKLFTLPEEPPPVLVSGFGPKSIEVAGRIGDGFCTASADREAIELFRASGGGGKPVQAGAKVCFGSDEAESRRTAHRLWPNDGLPGELAQVLPTPEHFEQASSLVTEEMIGESMPCGPDLDRHVAHLQEYADAGVDEVYVQQVGGNHDEFFEAYAREVLPRFG